MTILKLLTFIFFLSGICFSQTNPINIPGLVELKDMEMVGDRIYAVGCNSTDRTTPLFVCMNLKGDTIWTREYPKFCNNGKFVKLTLFEDTLYVIGSGTNGKYGYDRFSFMLKVTTDGKYIDDRLVEDCTLKDITHYNKYLWITGEKKDEKYSGMILYKFNGRFKESKGRLFTSDTDRRGEYIGQQIVIQDSIIWIGGTCEFKNYATFSITRVSHQLDSIDVSYPLEKKWGECQILFKDGSNNLWAAGKANKNNDSLGFVVTCYNIKGEMIFSNYHALSDHAAEVLDIAQATNGDVLIFSMFAGTPEIYIYRDTKFCKRIILTSYKDHLIQKVVEYEPNKFVILCLQLVGSFYGKSALMYW